MKYCLIKRAVNAITIDNDDENRDPETIKVYGKVTFTPLLGSGDAIQYAGAAGNQTIVLQQITVNISDGIIMHRGAEGVKLPAGGEGCNPKTIRWRADFTNLQAGGRAFTLKSVTFDAIPDGQVDLTIVAPLAGTNPPIVRGPQGVSVSDVIVDGSYLVFIGSSETGTSEIARASIEPVVSAASNFAADSVRTQLANDLNAAEAAALAAAQSASEAAASVEQVIDGIPDATASVKGKIKLTNDLGGTADAPTVPGLAGKADVGHTHVVTDVTNLQSALDGKAANSHTHTVGQVDGLQSALDGKASLVGGLVPTSQIPAVALTKPQVVSSRSAMLGLTAQEGDVAVITAGVDKGTYMLGSGSPAVFESWVALAAPTDAVTSVNGQTGVVNLSASNVGAAPSSHTHTSADITDAASAATASVVMKRDSSGRAQVADPAAAQDAATKAYVDNRVGTRIASIPTPNIVYGTDTSGNQATYNVKGGAFEWSLAQRGANGTLKVGEPSVDTDAATKKYVDTGLSGKAAASHTHTSEQISDAVSTATASMVIRRDSAGRAQVADPSVAADIATKGYVDTVAGPVSETTMTMWGATWYFTKVGRIVFVSTNGANISTYATWEFTSAIPEGYRPKYQQRLHFGDGTAACNINPNGSLIALANYSFPVSFSYLAA